MDWAEYALRIGAADEPPFLVELSEMVPFGITRGKKSKGSGYYGAFDLECQVKYEGAIQCFGAACAMATLFAVFQLANMIGETLLEYNDQKEAKEHNLGNNIAKTDSEFGQETSIKSSKTKNSFVSRLSWLTRGFQLMHGWNEALVGMLFEDVPQLIMMVIFSVNCEMHFGVVLRVFVWNFFKDLKSAYRVATCKHDYEPCCGKCCGEECCVYSYNFFCICRILYFRPCDCQRCCEVEKYDICPGCTYKTCERDGQCFGPIDEDPKCAKITCKLLQRFLVLMYVAVVALQMMSGFDVLTKFKNVI